MADESVIRTSEDLCKHDWVGDSNCAYCRIEILEGLLTEAQHIIEEAGPHHDLENDESEAWVEWRADWLEKVQS